MGTETIPLHLAEVHKNLANILLKLNNMYELKVVDDEGKAFKFDEITQHAEYWHNNQEYYQNSLLLKSLLKELELKQVTIQGNMREIVLIKNNMVMIGDMMLGSMGLKSQTEPEKHMPPEPPPFPKDELPEFKQEEVKAEPPEEEEDDFIADDEVVG